ncbi:lactonase family protein [Clostridium oryzae]|uniref:6-phosphogluconolactonase n=1 Tax=Clostridium oryzae TaxID=1450648 RepID=A0A1V4IBD4_9CLOT|nr:lactonase family protein [Clostridium oryzae]OPJ57308.1 6-phosphogluconolactonase [Clostridium oryzae]
MEHNLFAYIGTYTSNDSKGIYKLKLNAENNLVLDSDLAAAIDNPSYIITDNNCNYLYSVMELQDYDGIPGGAVSAFKIDHETGKLDLINSKPTYGKDPCHLTLSSNGKYLFVSNYSSGSLTVFRMEKNGSIGDRINFIQHTGSGPNKDRQEAAHVHSSAFSPDGKHLCVVDLGCDKLFIYDFNNEDGSLKYNDELTLDISPGSGPRHLAFHPKCNFLYVINELSSEVTVLKYDSSTFKLKKLQTLSTIPQDYNHESLCAAIKISPDGRFLYASNRGHNSIAIFKIEKNIGTLEFICVIPTGGDFPRDITITPDGNTLYAANQKSDSITVFHIDKDTGILKKDSEDISISIPVCICFCDFNK